MHGAGARKQLGWGLQRERALHDCWERGRKTVPLEENGDRTPKSNSVTPSPEEPSSAFIPILGDNQAT